MRTSIWYRNEQHQPDKSGYYLSYRGWGMGGNPDGDSEYGLLYYHKQSNAWYEYESGVKSMYPKLCIVYYWTDATPCAWTDSDPPSIVLRRMKKENNVALKDAWEQVQKAIHQYNMIKQLVI